VGVAVLLFSCYVHGNVRLLGGILHEVVAVHWLESPQLSTESLREAGEPFRFVRVVFGKEAATSCNKRQELAHYALATTDIEYRFPFGWDELWGIANRGDFDLKCHTAGSGVKLKYVDPVTKEVRGLVIGFARTLLPRSCNPCRKLSLTSSSRRWAARAYCWPYSAMLMPRKLSRVGRMVKGKQERC
jgi:hypothetical protein